MSNKFWVRKKNFVWKNVGSEKILGPEKFWFKNLFGSNKIYGLKILRPEKILGLEKDFGFEKYVWKNLRPKNFGSGKFVWKKLQVQKKFDLKKSSNKFGPNKILCVEKVLSKNIWSKKFDQNRTSNSWDIAFMDKCHQGICCQDKCHHSSWHLLNMVQRYYL